MDRDAAAAGAGARELLAAGDTDEAAAVALLVLGLSLRTSDYTAAATEMRRAVGTAESLDLPLRAAQARTSLLVMLSHQGHTREALREADLAEAALREPDAQLDLARLRVNKGLVLQRLGRSAEALTCYAAAEPVLIRYRDVRWEVVMLSLRGTMLAYQGKHDAAATDLRRGIALAESAGLHTLLCRLHQNLGFALLRSGRIPDALREISRALQSGELIGAEIETVLADRADALLTAGLAVEALENAERAIAGQLKWGRAYDAAESRLMAARAALAANQVGRASGWRPRRARSSPSRAGTRGPPGRGRSNWPRASPRASPLPSFSVNCFAARPGSSGPAGCSRRRRHGCWRRAPPRRSAAGHRPRGSTA